MNQYIIIGKMFFMAGAMTFSGGLGMVPLLKESFVEKHKLISEDDFYHYMALAQSIPGVTAITSACLVGEKIGGVKGRYIGGISVLLPALIVMLGLSILHAWIPNTPGFNAFFIGVRATASVFVLEAAYDIGKHYMKNWHAVCVIVLVGCAVFFFNISVIYILMICLIVSVVEVSRQWSHSS